MSPIHRELLLPGKRIDTHYELYVIIDKSWKENSFIFGWEIWNFEKKLQSAENQWSLLKNNGHYWLKRNKNEFKSRKRNSEMRNLKKKRKNPAPNVAEKVKFERTFCDWFINKIDAKNYDSKLF